MKHVQGGWVRPTFLMILSYYPTGLQWGANGDRPVPGDYDGDGKTDYGVWRSTDGTNYIIKNSGGFLGVVWGGAGDVPVLGSPMQ